MATTGKGLWYPDTSTGNSLRTTIQTAMQSVDDKISFNRANGSASVSVSSASSASVTVTLPAGRFTAAPRIFCQPAGTTVWLAYPSAVTTGQFTLTIVHRAGTTVTTTATVWWWAVQGASGSSDG